MQKKMKRSSSHCRCILCGRNREEDEMISYFHFPLQHPHELQVWADFCNIQLPLPSKNLLLCSRHFEDDALTRTINNSYILKKKAIPTKRCEEKHARVHRSEKRSGRCCLLCGYRTERDVSYFAFPKDERAELWADFCHISLELLSQYGASYLCCKHFTQDDVWNISNRKALKFDAVPTITTVDKPTKKKSGKCLLCGYLQDTDRHFFKFPKDMNDRQLWAKFCKIHLDEISDTHSRLCSEHFTKENILFDDCFYGKRTQLKPNAIPSIYGSSLCIPKWKKHLFKLEGNTTRTYSTPSAVAPPPSPMLISNDSQPGSINDEITSQASNSKSTDTSFESEENTTRADSHLSSTVISPPSHIVSTPSPTTSKTRRAITVYPPKDIFHKHRYFGDFRSPDLLNPEHATKFFHLAKNLVKKKRNALLSAQRTIRILQKRIKNLENVVEQLVLEKHNISDHGANVPQVRH